MPALLLTLGAGCLLVAALVFLAVSWSVLGVSGRTAVLVVLTAASGLLTARAAQRGLRTSTETVGVVGLGLLTLDVLGAWHAGWLGELSTPSLSLVLGSTLLLAGTGAALLVRRTPVGTPLGSQLVAIGGAVLAVGALTTVSWWSFSAGLVAAVLLSGAATVALHRQRLRVASHGLGVLAALAWLVLVGTGWERGVAAGSLRSLWWGAEVWPLLVAAVVAGALAAPRFVSPRVRLGAAASALAVVALAATAPAVGEPGTTVVLTALAVLVVTGLGSLLLPRRWSLAPALTQVAAGLVALAVSAEPAAIAAERLLRAGARAWAGSPGGRLPVESALPALAAPWLLPVVALALLGTALTVARASRRADRLLSTTTVPVAGAVVVAAGVAALASYPVPVWAPLAALVATAAGATAWWRRTGAAADLGTAAVFLAAAVLVSGFDEILMLVALGVAVGLTAAVHLVAGQPIVATVAGALLGGSLAGWGWTLGAALDLDPALRSALTLLAIGGIVVGLGCVPSAWWPARSGRESLLGLELGTAAAAVPVAVAGALLAPVGEQATWVAVYLTVAGAVTTLSALLRPDRRVVAWTGGALLAAASWVRLWDIGVRAPEAYTLPTAAVLLAVGLLRLHRERDLSTVRTLLPGLGLGLVPSLLWALADPSGPRALLVGLAALALVLLGVRLGWTAPLLVGAGVGALLTLRLAMPYLSDAVPRWALLGGAGLLLVALGLSWEQRLREARALVGFVRELR